MSARHVVVTGAGTGIGRAIAVRLAGDGDAVSLIGLERGQLEETATLVHGRTHLEPCDIRDRGAVDGAGEGCERDCG